MMMVSLSEQAKQPLSLPLPPKVFFHLSSTSLTLCSWFFLHCVVNIVSPLPFSFSLYELMFLIISFSEIPIFFFFFCFVQPLPSFDHVDMTLVLWLCCGHIVFPGPCGVVPYNCVTAIGSEPNQINYAHKKVQTQKGHFLRKTQIPVFKLEFLCFLFSWAEQ